MFITLKVSPDDGHEDGSMEQITSRNASRARPRRRVACVSCQRKKLRCTGETDNCDRCISRAIPCVTLESKTRSRTRAAATAKQHPLESNETATPNGIRSSLIEASSNTQGSASTDTASEAQRQRIANMSLPALLAWNMKAESLHPNDNGVEHTNHANFWSQTQKPLDLAGAEIPNEPSSCSCVENALSVVQKLEDDDFHLASLSFDEVIQLQKWIMLQCCKPLDCAACATLPMALTVLVLVCERLTDMFDCVRGRLKKAAIRLAFGALEPREMCTGHESPANTAASVTSDDRSAGTSTTSSQLCADCGRPIIEAVCNSDIFATAFRDLYANEEQVEMIRVLLNLQVRNFRGLLKRIDDASQVPGGEARRQKLHFLYGRMDVAQREFNTALAS